MRARAPRAASLPASRRPRKAKAKSRLPLSAVACFGLAGPGGAGRGGRREAGGGMEGPPAPASGAISLHNFSARLWEQLIHFHVMRLTDSLFLWVGATPTLRNLAVAMCNRYDSIPVSTSLLGDTSDTTSNCLAQRLARKTKKQVFVSYNLQNTDSNFTLLIENRIKEEMDAFPEKF